MLEEERRERGKEGKGERCRNRSTEAYIETYRNEWEIKKHRRKEGSVSREGGEDKWRGIGVRKSL